MGSKHYPEECRIEDVQQVIDRGHPVSNVAKRLSITAHSLYACIKTFPQTKSRQ